MAKKLRNMFVGDEYPFHYFRLWEKGVNANGDVQKLPMNLTTDVSTLKYCARHCNNKASVDDDTASDIYGDLTVIVANGQICAYEWQPNDLPATKIGKWTVTIYGVKTTGEPFHFDTVFEFYLNHKHQVGLTDRG
jgi:hypothetical protein